MAISFKKTISIALLSIFSIVLLAGLGVWVYSKTFAPQYDGEIQSAFLQHDVQVRFDEFGVPHIKAETQQDAQWALGYLHASERMFQMELLRRLSQGRMAEMVGPELLKTDCFFRTLGLHEAAKKSVFHFDSLKQSEPELWLSTNAYLRGINDWINENHQTLETKLVGATIDSFTIHDVYSIVGLMSFGFAEAFRIDPVVQSFAERVSQQHLFELDSSIEPLSSANQTISNVWSMSESVNEIMMHLPAPPWMGSNSWVISGSKSKSGKPIFCNDTHMGYQQPSVWFEAHIEVGDFEHYGNYLAGFPFPLVGHSKAMASGLTMFENDDTDFYYEEISDGKYKFKNELLPLISRTETVHIKGQKDTVFIVNETHHGPILNSVFESMKTEKPFSVWCAFLKFPSKALETTYRMQHATNINDAEKAASMLDAPGLNMTFADTAGNIGWWAAARLFERPNQRSGKLFLNGSSGNDEIEMFKPFSYNPQSVNPTKGIIVSSNQATLTQEGKPYPGYYVPHYRANRITQVLSENKKFTTEDMKQLIHDDIGLEYTAEAKNWAKFLDINALNELEKQAIAKVLQWDGNHSLQAVEPVIYYRWLYFIARETMVDEVGQELFNQFMNTHWMKVNLPNLLSNASNSWWDNTSTNQKETQKEIIQKAFGLTIEFLTKQLGEHVTDWKWEKVHTLQLKHPFGQAFPANAIFNLKEMPIAGGNEVVNNTGFSIDSSGLYPVHFGPAMRRIIDLSHTDSSWSVLPSGQSGVPSSKHYSDQQKLYYSNQLRGQWMGKHVNNHTQSTLIFKPSKK